MGNSFDPSPSIGASFRITLVGFTPCESAELENALPKADGRFNFDVHRESCAASAIFPLEAIHAVVFTPTSVMRATPGDVSAIRSAMKPGTCRVYLLVPHGAPPPAAVSSLDDFVQRSNSNGVDALAKQIIAFFRDAVNLNRVSTLFALRDATSLGAYRILKVLWPLSYVVATFHVINAVALLAGRGPWPITLASRYVVPGATFFGAFFIVHCIFVVLRNALFAARIVKYADSGLAFRAGVLGLAAAATARSIAALDGSPSRVIASVVLAVGAYVLYIYARRIRAECTSLSQLQGAISDPRRRTEVLNSVGRQRLTSEAFPFRPFRFRSLFISYMHGSKWSSQTAELIYRSAERAGFSVWMDQSSIPSGSLWRQYLLRALSQCGFFIAVLDGDRAATDWVLAESTYAAMLRKTVGKPRILIVARDADALVGLRSGPFGIIYQDVFELRSACPGAAILAADRSELSSDLILDTLERVPAMGLLLQDNESQPFHVRATTHSSVLSEQSATVSDDLEVADHSWKTSVLLLTLVQGDGSAGGAEFLATKSADWLQSTSSTKKTIALNILRSLFKAQHFDHDPGLTNVALELLVTDVSLAVKLAALDLLGALKASPNSLSRLSDHDAKQLADFRSALMTSLNASQRLYAAEGVQTDVASALAGKTHRQAMMSTISRIDGGS